jgi:hypothetical protein
MTHKTIEAGWFVDPDRHHELRWWNGDRWTDEVADGGVQAADPLHHPGAAPPGRGDRDARIAFTMLFAGVPLSLILVGAWSIWMGTSSLGGDESTLVRGWEGVLRNAPALALMLGVVVTSFVFAAHALRHGARYGNLALWFSSAGLLFVLATITRDCAEVVMETRSATVAWILFAVDVVVTAAAHLTARWWARRTT